MQDMDHIESVLAPFDKKLVDMAAICLLGYVRN